MEPTSKWLFFPGTPEIAPNGIPATLEPHNFVNRTWIAMQDVAKL
jgi:hypothetical protein